MLILADRTPQRIKHDQESKAITDGTYPETDQAVPGERTNFEEANDAGAYQVCSDAGAYQVCNI